MTKPAPKTILHIDDDPMLLTLTRNILGSRGFNVDTLNEPGQLRDYACPGCDLLVLDYMMPGMSGLEVCQRVRAEGYQGPVLILTSTDLERDERYKLKALCEVVRPKPFGPRHLIERVQELLAEKSCE